MCTDRKWAIDNCGEACVHAKPSKDSEILGLVRFGTEVMVLADDSTFDFEHICTRSGLEGYVSKDFIVLRSNAERR